ncbi:MAG: hypothetical protein ACI9LU_002142 [Polaribacter sp.]|jgi:hypothetical protein
MGFIKSIFDAAQTWQDTNQIYLSEYRERVIRLYLKEDEGGLNLERPPAKIDALASIGKRAGTVLKDDSDLAEHKWRRLLSAYAAIESALKDIREQYLFAEPQSMEQFVDQYVEAFKKGNPIATSYKPTSQRELLELQARLNGLIELATSWTEDPIRNNWGGGNMPKPSSALNIVPQRFVS